MPRKKQKKEPLPRVRGVELVERVIAAVSEGRSEIEIFEPRPVPKAVIDKLTLGGKPLPPSLKRWLAFDGSWLVREYQWFSEPEEPSFELRTMAQLCNDMWGENPWAEVFESVERLPEKGLMLDTGSDSFRFLYVGNPDSHGEYPVFFIDTDDAPMIGLEVPGLDLWFACSAGLLSTEEMKIAYADAFEEHQKLSFDGKEYFEWQGDWETLGGEDEGEEEDDESDEEEDDDEGDEDEDDSDEEEDDEDEDDDDDELDEEEAEEEEPAGKKQNPEEKKLGGKLKEAIELGDTDRAKTLLTEAKKKFPGGAWLKGALVQAVYESSLEMVDLLLKAGADPNTKGTYATVLSSAARSGETDIVKRLLAAKADPNLQPVDSYGDKDATALHEAVEEGHLETAVALLDGGANLNALDDNGRTPLIEAVEHPAIVKVLLARGAAIDTIDGNNRTALHEAVEERRRESARILIEAGAALDLRNWCGDTALHIAMKNGSADLVSLLVKKGARRDIANDDGWTVQSFVDENGLVPPTVDIAYAAGAAPQRLKIELEIVTWDKTYTAQQLPLLIGSPVTSLVALATAGGAGSDLFAPSAGTAKVLEQPSAEGFDAELARHTFSWTLEVASVAPSAVATLATQLASSLGARRTSRLAVRGDLPTAGASDVLDTESWSSHAERLLPKAWPSPSFSVSRGPVFDELTIRFHDKPAQPVIQNLNRVLHVWTEQLAVLPDHEGNATSMLRMLFVQATKPKKKGDPNALTFGMTLHGASKEDAVPFPFLRAPAEAILLNMLEGFSAAARVEAVTLGR